MAESDFGSLGLAPDVEPTDKGTRRYRPSRLFWAWFAVNSSVLSVVVGAGLVTLGMSLRQAIVAALAGAVLASFPLGLAVLAGTWSGQPTMVVSRATFGVSGNLLPVAIALVTRAVWGAVLLWLAVVSTARVIVTAGLNGPLDEAQLTSLALVLGVLATGGVAHIRPAVLSRLLLAVSIVSAALATGFIVTTVRSVDVATALAVGDGPGILVISGAALTFSVVGVAWAMMGADLTRRQLPSPANPSPANASPVLDRTKGRRRKVTSRRAPRITAGTASMGWAALGLALPAIALLAYGALLAAGDAELGGGLVAAPIDTLASILPTGYPILLVVAISLSLLAGVVVNIYSAGLAIQSAVVRINLPGAVAVASVAVGLLTVVFTFFVADAALLARDLATTLAVPVGAWAGLFSAEMLLRQRRFDSRSLLMRGGVYPDVNGLNVAMLVVAGFVGLGLTTAATDWLDWQGYLFVLFGAPLDGDLASSDVGVLVAFAIGLATPVVAGIRAIRSQEAHPDRSLD